MHFNTAVALLAGAAAAAPHAGIGHAGHAPLRRDIGSTVGGAISSILAKGNSTSNSTGSASAPAGGYKSVVYWGQSVNKPLADVCKEPVDTVVMSFVNAYGTGTKDGHASANPGWLCATNSTDSWAQDQCKLLGKNVTSCQSAGKKVLMSIGGWIDDSKLGPDGGKKLADDLMTQYGQKGDGNVLGGVTLDGFDFDIEHDNDDDKLAGYVDTVKELRSKMDKDMIITGAPMCAPSKGNPANVMTNLMAQGQFDELYFQYYNNAPCGANDTKGAVDAWDSWYQELQGGASKDAKIFLGLLGAPGGTSKELEAYYIDEPKVIDLVNEIKTHKGFAGIMTWDAGNAMNETTPSGNFLNTAAKAIGKGK